MIKRNELKYKMSCYQCGQYGHKKEKCPQRIIKIKCYECDAFGHYKNNCPIILEKAKVEAALKRQQESEKWVQENLPDVYELIKNKEEIKNMLLEIQKLDHGGY